MGPRLPQLHLWALRWGARTAHPQASHTRAGRCPALCWLHVPSCSPLQSEPPRPPSTGPPAATCTPAPCKAPPQPWRWAAQHADSGPRLRGSAAQTASPSLQNHPPKRGHARWPSAHSTLGTRRKPMQLHRPDAPAQGPSPRQGFHQVRKHKSSKPPQEQGPGAQPPAAGGPATPTPTPHPHAPVTDYFSQTIT